MNLQQRRTATKLVFGTLVGIIFLVTLGFVIRFVVSSAIISSAKGQAKIIIEQAKKQAETEKNRAESEARDAEAQRAETIKALDQQISDTGEELRNRDQQINNKGQQLKALDENLAKASSNSDKDQQIKERDQQIKDRDQKLKDAEQQRKDLEAKLQKLGQQTPVALTNNRDQEVKDRDQKIKDLEARIQKLSQPTPQPSSQRNNFDEGEAGLVLIRHSNHLIKPLVEAINNDKIAPGHSLNRESINYNRQVVQKSLKNYRAILQNLSNIDREKGAKFRACVAQISPRIWDAADFDLKYDNGHGHALFNKDYLNRLMDAANDEKTDINYLIQVFDKSFWLFMQPHFVEWSERIDDWHIAETISEANTRIYDVYHH